MQSTRIDWVSMIVPLVGILALGAAFIIIPESSQQMLDTIRGFLGDDLGIYYILLGILAFGATLFMAFSKFGNIKLGKVNMHYIFG